MSVVRNAGPTAAQKMLGQLKIDHRDGELNVAAGLFRHPKKVRRAPVPEPGSHRRSDCLEYSVCDYNCDQSPKVSHKLDAQT